MQFPTLSFPGARRIAPPASPQPASPVSAQGMAHAFGIMLARDYPDGAYDLADAVARGVQLGLKGDA